MRVAICYDWLDSRGGAERILSILKIQYPEATFFSLIYDRKCVLHIDKSKLYTSWLSRFVFIPKIKLLIPILGPVLWRKFDFTKFDFVVVLTSDNAIHARIPVGTKACYLLLTPPRYLWTEAYEIKKRLLRVLVMLISPVLRLQYFYCVKRKKINTISKESAKRFKTFCGVDANIIYPPIVRLNCGRECPSLNKNYFLVVSRLVAYKRIDIVIEAFKRLNLPLVVIGDGDKYEELRSLAGPNTKFLQKVDDTVLAEYYQNAIAVVFPTYEDFGLVPIEAQWCGTPVIAYAKGGAVETVIPGRTGVFFEEQTATALSECLVACGRDMEELRSYFARFRVSEMRWNAKKYSQEAFLRQILTTMA